MSAEDAAELAAGYEIGLTLVHAALAHFYLPRETLEQDLRQQVAKTRILQSER